MTRRELLACLPAPLFAHAGREPSTLVHEHILVDFAGAGLVSPARYDRDEVFRVARPKLQEIAKLGCRRLLECTPNYLGRDPLLLRRLSDATGIEIWTNTGLYAANGYKHLPPFAATESAGQLARRWVEEARRGVDGSKPRFIKIGVNAGPLGELDRKLVRAAAIASKETGLTIASHTAGGVAALEQLEIVTALKVEPAKFVWVHAQSEKDHTVHERIARAGAWLEFDGIAPDSAAWHEACVRAMDEKGLLSRTLISQDAGWYHVGEPGGGEYRGYAFLYAHFLPRLEAAWARQLITLNPAQAFGR